MELQPHFFGSVAPEGGVEDPDNWWLWWEDVEHRVVYYRASPAAEPVRRTWANVLDGLIPWSALTSEEVARCQLRNKNGSWQGSAPQRLPRGAMAERKRDLMARVAQQFEQAAVEAAAFLGTVLADENADIKDRIAAADRILDRGIGPKPQKLEVTAEVKPWEGLVGSILVDVDEQDTSQ